MITAALLKLNRKATWLQNAMKGQDSNPKKEPRTGIKIPKRTAKPPVHMIIGWSGVIRKLAGKLISDS